MTAITTTGLVTPMAAFAPLDRPLDPELGAGEEPPLEEGDDEPPLEVGGDKLLIEVGGDELLLDVAVGELFVFVNVGRVEAVV